MADSPKEAKGALIDALESGFSHYVSSQGIPELREIIAEKLINENDIQVGPENIIVTPGAKYAIYLGLRAMIGEGDEVLMPSPGWLTYEAIILMASGNPVYYPCYEANDFNPLIEDLEKRITKRTKMVMLTTPSNPTGAVIPKDLMADIGELALKNGLYVVSDEIYEKFVFDGRSHSSMAAIPEMRDKTLTINGFSKGWAMTGWRIGYGVANKNLIKTMTTMTEHTVTCTCAFTQKAAVIALEKSASFVEELADETQRKRDIVVNALNRIQGISCISPAGSFYAFANIKETGKSAEELSSLLLERAGVITLPGTTFGELGEGYLRFSYALPLEQVEEGMKRTEGAFRNL
jgi:aminotransferase